MGNLSERQKAQLEVLKGEVSSMVAEAVEAQWAKAEERAASAPKPHDFLRGLTHHKVGTQEMPKGGCAVARCLRYLYHADNNVERAIKRAHDSGDVEFAKAWGDGFERVQIANEALRAMSQDSLTAGGALVPPGFVSDFVEELQAKAVVRSLGLEVMPMAGSLTMPYEDTPPTVSYVGEAENATESTGTYGQLQLTERKLVGLSAISNDLLRNGSPQAERSIKNRLVRAVAAKEDLEFIQGDGTQNKPKGILYWTIAANKFNANGTVSVANVTTDAGKAMNKLAAANVPMDGCGWIFSPRTYLYLSTALDGNSNPVWARELGTMANPGTWYGYPWRVSTQIVENLGGGTNETKVYFANLQQGYLLGESLNMEMALFKDAAYYNGSSVVSGISTDQSAVRVISAHDFGARYRGKESAVIQAVKWGA